MAHALFVEDNAADRRIADRLTRDGLPTTAVAPPATVEDLVASLADEAYSILLLDYRLDDAGTVSYRGGSAAAAVREAVPDMPIGLITTEAKLHEWVASNPQIRTLFDVELLKAALVTSPGRRDAVARIEATIDAFERIKELENQPGAAVLKTVLGADDRELAVIGQLIPEAESSSVASIARLVRLDVLEVNGPLLDAAEVRVRLGLYPADIDRHVVQDWLRPARYEGIFGSVWVRWWRGRLVRMLREVGIGPDLPAKDRVAKLSEEIGSRLRSEACVWCGEGQTGRACSVCRKAVEHRHSVEVRTGTSREYEEPAVVCFLCIQEGRAERIIFIVGSEPIVSQLRSGAIVRPQG